jgi:ribose 5-phosphate isomerase B
MIYLGADKHGFQVMRWVEKFLKKGGIPFSNVGVQTRKEDMALEELIPKVVSKVKKSKVNKAILVCGTGIGVQVGANKFKGIRACLAVDEKIAEWAVVYDNCNIVCLAGWKSNQKQVNKILDAWFNAKYDGSKKRLKMLQTFETWR